MALPVERFVDFGRALPTILIAPDDDHPGAGACLVDNVFTNEFLNHIDAIRTSLPLIKPEKDSRNARRMFFDALRTVDRVVSHVIQHLPGTSVNEFQEVFLFPHMRFLEYQQEGCWCPPHTDIGRTDRDDISSTHTFILYLETVEDGGGGTALLHHLPRPDDPTDTMAIKHKITPHRGRLLWYPHATPHAGLPIIENKKTLIRGEVYISEHAMDAEFPDEAGDVLAAAERAAAHVRPDAR